MGAYQRLMNRLIMPVPVARASVKGGLFREFISPGFFGPVLQGLYAVKPVYPSKIAFLLLACSTTKVAFRAANSMDGMPLTSNA